MPWTQVPVVIASPARARARRTSPRRRRAARRALRGRPAPAAAISVRPSRRGRSFERTPEQESASTALVAGAEVLFGIPARAPERSSPGRSAPRPGLRFVQATAAGAGQQVRRAELTREELERVAISSASGVHAVPLAEWSIFGLLAFAKGLPAPAAAMHARRLGRTTRPGSCAARRCSSSASARSAPRSRASASAFGMRVIGVKRDPPSAAARRVVHPPEQLRELVGDATRSSSPCR